MNETVRPIHRKAKSRTRSGRRMPTRSTSPLSLPIARAYGPATTSTMCEQPGGGARAVLRWLQSVSDVNPVAVEAIPIFPRKRYGDWDVEDPAGRGRARPTHTRRHRVPCKALLTHLGVT